MAKELITVKDLLGDNEMIQYITEDLEDFEDNTKVSYEVWAIGYDSDNKITDVGMFIADFNNPDEAIKKAEQLVLADIIQQASEESENVFGEEFVSDVTYISVEVETVIDDPDGDGTMNIGTIFRKTLCVNEEDGPDVDSVDPIVTLKEGEYSLLDDGTLKVNHELLKNFNKNDYVNIKFIDENESFPLTYKIISKVTYEDADYFHCEFIY